MIGKRVLNFIEKIITGLSGPLMVLGIIFSLYLFIEPNVLDTALVMRLFGLMSIALIGKLFTSDKIVSFGPSFIIALYSIITCFGYDILVLILGNEQFLIISQNRHAYTEYFNKANALLFIGNCMLVIGMQIGDKIRFKLRSTNSDEEAVNEDDIISNRERNVGINISSAIVALYAGILIINVLTGRLRLTNYATVKEWFAGKAIMSYLLRLSWVAMPTAVYYAQKKNDYLKIAVPTFFMFVVLMLSGNRNEILYPLAMAVGVFVWKRYYREKKQVPAIVLIIALAIVAVLNPLISSTRKIGIGISTLVTGRYGLIYSLSEMGAGINTCSITLYAIETGQASFLHGMSIIMPVLALLTLNIIVSTKVYQKLYSPSVILNAMGHYGRGYTWVSEFYLNFGLIGTVLGLLLLGKFMATSESSGSSMRRRLFFFQISPLFMLWVRNSLNLNFIIVIFAVLLNLGIKLCSGRLKTKPR